MTRAAVRGNDRSVCGLVSAQALDAKPACIPNGRPRGVKARGISYEKACAAALQGAFPKSGVAHGQWFEFADANGRGYAQVDLLLYIVALDQYVVGECKLTDVAGARQKLANFYLPIVAMAFGKRASGFVVTRHLTQLSNVRNVCATFRDALGAALNGGLPTWHYLGKGPP